LKRTACTLYVSHRAASIGLRFDLQWWRKMFAWKWWGEGNDTGEISVGNGTRRWGWMCV